MAHSQNDHVYKVTRKNCGFVLVLNQNDFKDPKISKLPGTEQDCIKLQATFESRGYKVIIKTNRTHEGILKAVNKIVDKSGSKESLIVCIISHGNDGVIAAYDKLVRIKDIQNIIESEILLDKPKMLLIDACQGEKPLVLLERAPVADSAAPVKSFAKTHASPQADMLIASASVSGHESYMYTKTGSWFIQELCNAIDKYGDDKHMLDLLTNANNAMGNYNYEEDGAVYGQLLEVKNTLKKAFYLPKRG